MRQSRILAAVTLVATAAMVAVSTAGRSSSTPAAASSPVVASHYASTGPGADCGGDACGIGFGEGPSFTVPAGRSPYAAVIMISMQYVTSAKGQFTFGASVARGARRPLTAQPESRRLGRSTSLQSTTLVYRVRHLHAGHYTVRYGPSIGNHGIGHSAITTHRVLVTVTATPDHR